LANGINGIEKDFLPSGRYYLIIVYQIEAVNVQSGLVLCYNILCIEKTRLLGRLLKLPPGYRRQAVSSGLFLKKEAHFLIAKRSVSN
jgi:hypothetical protein